MKKVWTLVFIILCAMFIGFETVAKMIGIPSYNIGYTLAVICFAAALLAGAKR